MPEIEALADCLSVVVDEVLSGVPEGSRETVRLTMALFVRADLGQAAPAVRSLIARVFSVPEDAI